MAFIIITTQDSNRWTLLYIETGDLPGMWPKNYLQPALIDHGLIAQMRFAAQYQVTPIFWSRFQKITSTTWTRIHHFKNRGHTQSVWLPRHQRGVQARCWPIFYKERNATWKKYTDTDKKKVGLNSSNIHTITIQPHILYPILTVMLLNTFLRSRHNSQQQQQQYAPQLLDKGCRRGLLKK